MGFDTLVKVAKGKFPDMDLTDLKVEDYVDQASIEVGSPASEEVKRVPLEVTREEGLSSRDFIGLMYSIFHWLI